MQNKRIFLLFALIALLAVAPACGRKAIKTEGVTGVVTLDGNPLPFATVKFIPKEGGNEAVGITDETGKYKLQTLLGKADAGTTPGKYAVAFDCYEDVETGKTYTNEDGEEVAETEGQSVIPEMYNNPETSGFEVDVQKGKNTFDFDLVSE